MPYPITYFLEVGPCVLLKLANKWSFRGEENYENLDFQAAFLKQKRRSANEKISLPLINLALLYLV